jgi:hypothetical protein
MFIVSIGGSTDEIEDLKDAQVVGDPAREKKLFEAFRLPPQDKIESGPRLP